MSNISSKQSTSPPQKSCTQTPTLMIFVMVAVMVYVYS